MSNYPKYRSSGCYELSNGTEIKGDRDKAVKEQIDLDMSMAKFTAVFQRGMQIGPESWDTEYVTKQLTEDTTIGELKKWYASQCRNVRSKMQLTINEERES